MTLLDKLQAHKGGLLRLKTRLYWYGSQCYDNNPGRVCLILDAAFSPGVVDASGVSVLAVGGSAFAFLLLDGQPRCVWVVEADIELLVNDPPTN